MYHYFIILFYPSLSVKVLNSKFYLVSISEIFVGGYQMPPIKLPTQPPTQSHKLFVDVGASNGINDQIAKNKNNNRGLYCEKWKTIFLMKINKTKKNVYVVSLLWLKNFMMKYFLFFGFVVLYICVIVIIKWLLSFQVQTPGQVLWSNDCLYVIGNSRFAIELLK